MSAKSRHLSELLEDRFGDLLDGCVDRFDQVTIEVAPRNQLEICTALRDEKEFQFEQLMDVCGVDYLAYGEEEWVVEEATGRGFSRGVDATSGSRLRYDEEYAGKVPLNTGRRFAAVVHLLSISHNRRLRVRTFAPDDEFPVVNSLTSIWAGANWFEREAFDLLGIVFEGHQDLRRILTDYGFVGHPFRKDFPLSGNVEVRYDPDRQRVIYQPVSIEPRVLVPRVIRKPEPSATLDRGAADTEGPGDG